MIRLALLAALLAPITARADEPTEECLRTRIWDTYGDGWAVRTHTDARVGFGKTRFYKVSLLKGRAYRVLSCAGEPARDLDILLYDKEGRVLARDGGTDRNPSVAYTPPRSGIFFVVLYLRDSADRTIEVDASWALVHNDS